MQSLYTSFLQVYHLKIFVPFNSIVVKGYLYDSLEYVPETTSRSLSILQFACFQRNYYYNLCFYFIYFMFSANILRRLEKKIT